MSFTVYDGGIPCPACGAEDTVPLFVVGNRVRGPGLDGLEVADCSAGRCAECGHQIRHAEIEAAAEAKLEAWEPPSPDDIADLKWEARGEPR